MTIQETSDNRPLTRYETTHRRLWGVLNNTEGDSGCVISYWCHKLPVEPKTKDFVTPTGDITGKVFSYNISYDKLVNTKWAIQRLKDTFYTKSGSVRKKYSDIQGCVGWKTYTIQSLMCYLNQCVSEGKSNCILSWKEYDILVKGEIVSKKK